MRSLLLFLSGLLCASAAPAWLPAELASAEKNLVARHGETQHARITRGLHQVADRWRDEDGDAAVFREFVAANFAGDQSTLDEVFNRFERRLEVLDGHMVEMGFEFRLHTDLDSGRILPVDELFSAYAPTAHLADDFFANKIAFVALLNFPLTTLDQRLGEGASWSRRQWAEVRLAGRFEERIPASVNQEIARVQSEAELYINQYNIMAGQLVVPGGGQPFAKDLKLVTHWNLRDEIKARYSEGRAGLPAQRTIQRVMERIVEQSIPQVVINNDKVTWDPFANTVSAGQPGLQISNAAEPDTRYARLLGLFRANCAADAYSPTAPTMIARRFDQDRQMSEQRVKAMLEAVLSSPEFAAVGTRIRDRLGRPLEPFDIWFNGFRPRGKYTEDQLNEITRKRYPTAEAYQKDIPNILVKLGFRPEKAEYLRSLIIVQPSRGPGHAMGGGMRGQPTRLRTRVEANGMNYKGYNIAVHEMGHNVEQIFSMNAVDHTLLNGVPNTSFTEALAMLLQSHDMEVLGLAAPDERDQAFATMDLLWQTAEIGGCALVDMGLWHWMYEHPEATPAELRQAAITISRDVWNRFFAPVIGVKDSTILAIYSHMIFDAIYLPDYPIGHLIQYQVEEHMRKVGRLGDEYERITSFGNLPPDLWMKNATGAPVGPEALLRASAEALKLTAQP